MKNKITSATTAFMIGAIGMVSSSFWMAVADGWVYWLTWVTWAISAAFAMMHSRPAFEELTRWSRR